MRGGKMKGGIRVETVGMREEESGRNERGEREKGDWEGRREGKMVGKRWKKKR